MVTKRKDNLILGTGGHAKVVLAALASRGESAQGWVDPRPELVGTRIAGVEIIGTDSILEKLSVKTTLLYSGVGAARDTRRRAELFERCRKIGFCFPALIAASAEVSSSASLGAGCQILTRAVVHPDAVIGNDAVVNTAAVIEHDCRIGAHAFIGPGAVLCGGAELGDGAFVGAGAIILPGIRIGRNALVAAGMTLRRDLADGRKVVR